MAVITFPAGAEVTRSDLYLRLPGQIVLQSIYGSGSQVYSRGPGYWSGRLEIGQTDFASDAIRRRVELFLTRLRGRENEFAAPVERPSVGNLLASMVLTLSAAAIVSSELQITVTGAATGLVTGDYVRINGRLYQLTSDLAAGVFTAEPPAVPQQVGDRVVWEDVTCRARLAGEGPTSLWTPDFGGPWVLDWEEAI